MFTGLIEGKATATKVDEGLQGLRLELDLGSLADNLEHGESVAISGVCLSVIGQRGSLVSFEISPETLRKTWFSSKTLPGRFLNVERSLRADSRLGGHFVTGHVDGTGTLLSRENQGKFAELTFQAPSEVASLLIPKGSIAIDGVSLTIAGIVSDSQFVVALIPETLSVTALNGLSIGDSVHMEGDLLGKYVLKHLEQRFGGSN